MTTVKITCPQCVGQGLIGVATVTRCPQCSGTGMISQDDTQTLAALNSAITGSTNVQIVVTRPPALTQAVATVLKRNGKD